MTSKIKESVTVYGNLCSQIDESVCKVEKDYYDNPSKENYTAVYKSCLECFGTIVEQTSKLCTDMNGILMKESEQVVSLSKQVDKLILEVCIQNEAFSRKLIGGNAVPNNALPKTNIEFPSSPFEVTRNDFFSVDVTAFDHTGFGGNMESPAVETEESSMVLSFSPLMQKNIYSPPNYLIFQESCKSGFWLNNNQTNVPSQLKFESPPPVELDFTSTMKKTKKATTMKSKYNSKSKGSKLKNETNDFIFANIDKIYEDFYTFIEIGAIPDENNSTQRSRLETTGKISKKKIKASPRSNTITSKPLDSLSEKDGSSPPTENPVHKNSLNSSKCENNSVHAVKSPNELNAENSYLEQTEDSLQAHPGQTYSEIDDVTNTKKPSSPIKAAYSRNMKLDSLDFDNTTSRFDFSPCATNSSQLDNQQSENLHSSPICTASDFPEAPEMSPVPSLNLSIPNSPSNQVPDSTPQFLYKARAIYDYEKQLDDELTLKEGDVMLVLKENSDGWVHVNIDGNVGLVPQNYVAKI